MRWNELRWCLSTIAHLLKINKTRSSDPTRYGKSKRVLSLDTRPQSVIFSRQGIWLMYLLFSFCILFWLHCNAMRWSAVRCNVMWCNAIQFLETLLIAMWCFAMRCNAMLSAMRCDVMWCYVIQCLETLLVAMWCFAMWCDAMWCYAFLFDFFRVEVYFNTSKIKMLESVILTPVNVHVHYFTSVADLQSLKLHPAIFVHPYFFL